MKKTTGRVVSLVLALALVVTSFSGTFAFAATKSESGTVSGTLHDDVYVVNGDSTNNQVNDLLTWLGATLETKEHKSVGDVKISAISHSSGAALVKWKIDDNGNAVLTLKNTGSSGKETLSILYKGTYSDNDGNDVVVKASKNFTVNVYDKNDLVIGKPLASDHVVGTSAGDLDTFAKTQNSSQSFHVYSVATEGGTNNSAKVNYSPVQVTTKTNSSDATGGVTASDKASVSATGDVTLTVDTADKTVVTATVGRSATNGVFSQDGSVANVTITAKKIVSNNANTPVYSVSNKSDDKFTFKTKIEKKVDLGALNFGAVTNLTVKKSNGDTVITDGSTHTTSVKESEVVLPNGFRGNVAVDSGSIAKISGSAGNITVDQATISNGIKVALTGKISVTDDKSRVGDITLKALPQGAAQTPSVEVTAGKVGNIDTADCATAAVNVQAGTVGTINSKNQVSLHANNEDTAIVTGKITAPGVDVNADSAKITIAGIVAKSIGGAIQLSGEKAISTGTIDLDYRDTTVALGDDNDAFTGTIAAPINAKYGKITTENADTNTTVTGAVTVDTISVGSDTSIKFTDAIKVDTVDGDGTLTIAAGKLYITGSLSSVKLKLSDPKLTVGTVVMKADSDTVNVDDASPYGFTLDKSAGNSVDTFKIKTLTLAGLQINGDATRIAKGNSQTFTATAYPGGTSLPVGATIKWELNGSDQVFALTTNGNTATVKAISYDTTFASENKATLTATIQDADGYTLDDYGTAKLDLNAIAVPDVISDTNKDITVASGKTYQFKITSSTAPNFTLGTAGVFTVAPVVHPAGTNDYYYKITATGAVGKATGVFLNGNKLLVATVGAPAFKSDTTGNVTVKGAYTVKITADAVPNFVVGTAGVFNAQFVKVENKNEYYYRLTSVGKAGAQAGIFVNGVKTFVATVG